MTGPSSGSNDGPPAGSALSARRTTPHDYRLVTSYSRRFSREGASVKAVQKQLGHAAAGITLDTYGHLIPDEPDVLAGRLEDVHARALADLWPHDGPAVVALREDAGQ
jgi:integrase